MRGICRTICRRSIRIPDSRVLGGRQYSTKFTKDEDGMVNINTKEDWDEILATGKPIVADFWAPWCGKCTQISGFVEHLAEEHPNVTFVRMNTADEGVAPIKAALKIQVLPTFRFFNEGNEVGEAVTGYKRDKLENAVAKLAL